MIQKIPNDFAAFILSHGRPDKVRTYITLRKQGYTGRIIIVIDNEDGDKERYIKKYGGEVIIFDKKLVAKEFDEGDNFGDRRTIVYARNKTFGIAKESGINNFIQLDDDYESFDFRRGKNLEYKETKIKKSLDSIFMALLDFYKSIPAASIAISQNGDYIGGKNARFGGKNMLHRKCMNTFICSTQREFKFIGRINEDVNTYTNLGRTGVLFFTIPHVSINQKTTQTNIGGMTDLYNDSGTYVKSFYSVMYSPSCVHINLMGPIHKRLHHRVNWRHAVPCLVKEEK